MSPTQEAVNAAVNRLAARFKWTKRWAYRRTFAREDGALPRHVEIVLADLRDFCRAERTTFDRDERISALLEGRRSVFLRIRENLVMGDDDVARLVEVERE